MKWKLRRVRQCRKCPWKVSTDPLEIPHGYCKTKHAGLASTIADRSGNLATVLKGSPMRIMACHEDPEGSETHCIG